MKRQCAVKLALPAAILGFLALGFASLSACAATATRSIAVSATIASTCLVSATSLGFGSYSGLVAPASSTERRWAKRNCAATRPGDPTAPASPA